MNPHARSWDIHGITYAALEWGPENGTPVLALHGWMDHADSFRELAPRLTGCRVVALDLSGQGLSGHRAPHATYNIWDDLPQIAELLERLGWESCTLIGHSRGANIATLFAAALPERVTALVALDSLIADPRPDETVVETLRAFIQQTRNRMSRPPRIFESTSEYIARRQEQGNAALTSHALAERALAVTPEGVQMRGDPRLFASSAVRLTRAQLETVLKSLKCPVLNIWARQGIMKTMPRIREMHHLGATLIEDYTSIEIDGDHHFHLEPAAAARIATETLAFLNR